MCTYSFQRSHSPERDEQTEFEDQPRIRADDVNCSRHQLWRIDFAQLKRHVPDLHRLALIRHRSFLSRVGPPTPTRATDKAQGGDTEHLQAGLRLTTKDHGRKLGLSLLARSKRGTRFRTASLRGGSKHRKRRLGSPSVGRDQGTRRCRRCPPDDRHWR
jgi:hypothetical protein